MYPKIVIKDGAGATQYTYESKAIFPGGTRNFELESFNLKLGAYDNYGSLILVIPDRANALTSADTSRECKIDREWSVEFDLGISSGTLQRYFHGKVKDAQVDRPGTSLQQIILTCIGWGVILKERMTKMVRNQAKTSDGITLDDTDNTTRIDNLLVEIFSKKDHQVEENMAQLTTIVGAITTDGLGINSASTATKIANVNFGISTYAQAIDSLAGIANTMWRVNEDRKLVVHDPSAIDSGMLFSNDFTPGSDTVNWNGQKIGYLLQSPISWADESIDTYYSWLHGWGHFVPVQAASETTTPDATENLDDRWVGIKFQYRKDNLFKIAVRSVKTGTPATPTSVEIWGEDGTGSHLPSNSDIRRSIQIPKERLQALGTSTPAAWFEIPILDRLDITPNEILFIVFPQYGTAAHTINLDYKTGSGTYYSSTNGGVTWGTLTGLINYRVYSAERLTSSLEITDTAALLQEPRERMFPIRADMEEQTVRQTLLSVAEILGKQKRMYSNIITTIPQLRVNVGQSCKMIDRQTGLIKKVNIMGLNISADSREHEMGATTMELTLEENIL